MSWQGVLCISLGASLGAVSRWALSNWLNGPRPWGTLLANLLGAYLIGIAVASFIRWPTVTPEIRLGIVTGFLGALTTFSSFSAEIVAFLTARDYRWAVVLVGLHVVGSLLATLLGMWSFRACFE